MIYIVSVCQYTRLTLISGRDGQIEDSCESYPLSLSLSLYPFLCVCSSDCSSLYCIVSTKIWKYRLVYIRSECVCVCLGGGVVLLLMSRYGCHHNPTYVSTRPHYLFIKSIIDKLAAFISLFLCEERRHMRI